MINFSKTILFLLCVISIDTLSIDARDIKKPETKKPMMLKGSIDSSQLEDIPPFKIYFQGIQTISNDDGFFTIPLEKKEKSYSLLICKDFEPKFSSVNTVEHLTFNSNKSYKFYTFEKAPLPVLEEKIANLERIEKSLVLKLRLINRQINRKKSPSLKKRKRITSYKIKKFRRELGELKKHHTNLKATPEGKTLGDFWLIERKKFDPQPDVQIPDNCVIACLHPKTVTRVQNWSFPLSPNFVSFPKIILKKNLETRNVRKKQSITRSSLKSECNSFDPKVFHEQRLEQSKFEENTKITIVK